MASSEQLQFKGYAGQPGNESPPLMLKIWPVIWFESSEARNSAIAAMCSGRLMPNGIRSSAFLKMAARRVSVCDVALSYPGVSVVTVVQMVLMRICDRASLHGQGLRHQHHGRRRAADKGLPPGGRSPGVRRHDDDFTRLLRHHVVQGRPHHVQPRKEVAADAVDVCRGVDLAGTAGEGDRPRRRWPRDVDAAKPLDDVVEQAFHVLVDVEVRRLEAGLAARGPDLLHQLQGGAGRPGVDDDGGAVFGQSDSYGPTDPLAGTGHHCYLAAKVSLHNSSCS